MTELISTIGMSKECWLDHRQEGIGGSDVASVLGLNPYKSGANLFYEKVLKLNSKTENQAMHWGNALESIIADRWQYWDGDPESMILNYNNGKVKRNCIQLNAIVRNPDYPWLLANIDRIIEGSNQGVLEIKTVSGWATNQWEEGIPPHYLIQLQTYLLVGGYLYGEIAVLKDGRDMNVYVFEREESIIEKIIEKTKSFWRNVESARSLLIPYTANYEIISMPDLFKLDLPVEVKSELADLEPGPEDSKSYSDYLKERYRIIPSSIVGTMEILAAAINYSLCNEVIKDYEKRKLSHANTLKHYMKEHDVMTFRESGTIVAHKEDSRGTKRLTVRIENK